jgi:probable HAF family extracellular repeat protein
MYKAWGHLKFFLFLFSLVFSLTCSLSAYNYRVIDLGTLGAQDSIACSINDQGTVVGSSFAPVTGYHAFLWQNGAGMTDLGTLGGDDSQAHDVNGAGAVVGWSLTPAGQRHAFLWEAGQGMADLGTLDGPHSRAVAVNSHKQVVGWSNVGGGTYYYHAFIWTEDGGMADLGLPDIFWSKAWDINDSSQVIGWADDGSPTGGISSFIWEEGAGPTYLYIGESNYAYAINNAGQVVGRYTSYGQPWRAFFWEDGKGWTDLGTLGGMQSEAWDINEAGQVVGWAHNAAGEKRAFLWEEGTGMTDLGTMGGRESAAYAINDGGEIIGCSYSASGERRAFLCKNRKLKGLGTLGGVIPGGEAYAVNDTNIAAGWSSAAIRIGGVGDFEYTSSIEHAVTWSAGTIRDLGTLGGDNGKAHDINNLGQVVGEAGFDLDDWYYSHAFLWDEGTGMIDLGTLGGNSSEALAINDLCQVVGISGIEPYGYRAFLWEATSGMTNLGILEARDINNAGEIVGEGGSNRAVLWKNGEITDLGTLGGGLSYANAINEPGQVVGWAETSTGNNSAFLWDEGMGMTNLGTLGGFLSEALDINDQSQVVGRSYLETGEMHAFIWEDGPGMIDLNDRLRPGSPWILYSATGINSEGNISGMAYLEGSSHLHAVLIVPRVVHFESGAGFLQETFGDHAGIQ